MIRYSSLIKQSRVLTTLSNSLIGFVSLILKFRKSFKKNQKGIVLLCFHKLGDTVFTIPSVKRIADANNNDIIIFCFNISIPIYKLTFGNNVRFFSFNKEDFILGGRLASSRVRKTLKKLNPRDIIDLTGSFGSLSTFIFSDAINITGINKEIYNSLYTHFIPIKNFRHTTEIYANVARLYLNNNFSIDFSLFKSKINNSGSILIHPFAGWPAKEWGLNNFIDLASLLKNLREIKILTPPGRLTLELKNEISNSGIEIIETESIEDLINEVKDAFMVVANDSGVIYISNLLGIPTFTIYGPSNPSFHQLKNITSGYIQKQLPCSPGPDEKLCFTDGGRKGCPAFECMRRIDVQSVHSKILDLIQDIYLKLEISGSSET